MQNVRTRPEQNFIPNIKKAITEPENKNLIQTFTYFIVFLFFGFSNATLGLSLPTLATKVTKDVSQMGLIFTTKGLGGIIGSLVGGVLYDTPVLSKIPLNAHLFFSLSVLVLAYALFFIPLSTSYASLLSLTFIQGLGIGLINIGGNILLTRQHGKNVSKYALVQMCIVGLGSFLSPIVYGLSGLGILQMFTLWANFLALSSIIVSTWNFLTPAPRTIATEEIESTADSTTSDEISKSYLAVLVGVGLLGCVGIESGVSGLLYSYLTTSGMNLTPETFVSSFWLSYTLARLGSSILLQRGIRPQQLLQWSAIGCLGSLTLLMMFGQLSKYLLWIGIVSLSLSLASCYPMILSYPSSVMNLKVSGTLTSIMMVISSFGEVFVPALATTIGLRHFFVVLSGSFALVAFSMYSLFSFKLKPSMHAPIQTPRPTTATLVQQ
ncbi:hypothetical protein ABK040_006734 [Willaertia magna]